MDPNVKSQVDELFKLTAKKVVKEFNVTNEILNAGIRTVL